MREAAKRAAMAPSALLQTLVTTIAVALSLFKDGECCESIVEGAVDTISLPVTIAHLEMCMLVSDLDFTNGPSIAQADTCKRWVIQGLLAGVSIKDSAARGMSCAQMNGLNYKFAECLDRACQCPSLVETIAAVPINIVTHLPRNLLNLVIQGSNGVLSLPLSLLNLEKCMFISNLDFTDIPTFLQADTCKALAMQGLLAGVSGEEAYRRSAQCAERNDLPEPFQLCLRNVCLENSLIQNVNFFGFNMQKIF